MPLVKAGKIVEDQFVRVEDDAPLPDGVPVLLTAARFLADARELAERDAPVGVIWPNDRRVAELAPFVAKGRELYISYPEGIGTSKFTHTLIEKTLATRCTGRNWNTVLKLGAIAGGA